MPAKAIIRGPGRGRVYECGPMRAVFKADDAETAGRYSVSEWTVAPRSPGSGPHSHETNDELFLVTQGTMAVRVGDEWVDASAGTFFLIPAGITHDFENRTDQPATLFNVFIPGGFEHLMPQIVAWFAEPPSGAPTKASNA
ncbi:MAG TPA: cupin domain-containing protein [Candidatus Synoicihabitans sp.]|nr:cupin domain-containing protein [Candidatus Synoicihabitans sp.]